LTTAPTDTRMLILEFGAGFNTPGVIRRPGEHLTRRLPHSRLVRINPTHPATPSDLAERALSIPVGAEDLLEALTPLSTATAPR
ncbi:hypothetical protein, partial [Nocardia noduli]|uniref:hypothetical protein n=1 Tax=Nocardia noduli TaxID=2815722 RepID=UPI001C22CCA7